MAKKNTRGKDSKLLNHVTGLDTKTLQNVLKDNFGYGIDDLVSILNGDEELAKEVSDFGKQGRLAAKYAPRISQAISEGIEGTKVLNLETAKLLKQAGNAYTAIQKSSNQVLQANQKYLHDRELNALEYSLSNEQEKKRHEYAKSLLEMKYFYDTYFMEVDQDARLVEQSFRPELKQIPESERYQQARLDHLLSFGEDSDLDLVVQRDYLESDQGGTGILGTVKTFLGSLKSAAGF